MRPYNYGILWKVNYLKFYIDNIKLILPRSAISNVENWPFSGSFYFLMNIAVSCDWGGLEGVDDNIFPAIMEVDYVRVYQVKWNSCLISLINYKLLFFKISIK